MIDRAALLDHLQHAKLPELLGVYAFGSRITGQARPDSDLDLALLVAGYADPVALWELSSALVDLLGCPVDLLDFRAASTVLQYQILTTGERWWAKNWQTDAYEAAVLNDMHNLNTARAPLLTDILREGQVYAR